MSILTTPGFLCMFLGMAGFVGRNCTPEGQDMDTHQIEMHVIDAWLGTDRADLTDDQYDDFVSLVQQYAELRYNISGGQIDDDDAAENRAAWIAAYELATGTFDLEARGRNYRAAQDAAYMGAVMATLSGVSQIDAARRATISRSTLRTRLGQS